MVFRVTEVGIKISQIERMPQNTTKHPTTFLFVGCYFIVIQIHIARTEMLFFHNYHKNATIIRL